MASQAECPVRTPSSPRGRGVSGRQRGLCHVVLESGSFQQPSQLAGDRSPARGVPSAPASEVVNAAVQHADSSDPAFASVASEASRWRGPGRARWGRGCLLEHSVKWRRCLPGRPSWPCLQPGHAFLLSPSAVGALTRAWASLFLGSLTPAPSGCLHAGERALSMPPGAAFVSLAVERLRLHWG